MSTITNVKINTTSEEGQRDRVCSATITNAIVSDSGMYYCLAVHSKAVHTGNGSNLIVTESSTEFPTIKIISSSDSDGSSAPLLCLVSGVVPSQVHVFWLIDGRKERGLTDSTWTDNSDSATEFTRNQILVQAEEWDRGVQCTCVVEFEGNSTTKTVQRIVVVPILSEDSTVTQYPPVVEEVVGGNITMNCILEGLTSYCYTVAWIRLPKQPGALRVPKNTVINTRSQYEIFKNMCPVSIYNATVTDSGIYYCAVIYGQQIYLGNGTTVIVKGVVPSQVHVFWLIDGREDSGLTESTWTDNSDSATEFTRNQILVKAEEWDRGKSKKSNRKPPN
ncbi:unnamed protein product [Coregonus sp. 'balchen']|nr:unnamed protein product [Coregonus sp. 'balchen']